MTRRIAILLAALDLLACAGLAAAPLPSYGRLDGITVVMINDAFGPGPVDEWDDLCTFGFDATVPLGRRFLAEASYDALTWRGTSTDDASRIDVASALVGWLPPEVPIGALFLDSRVEAGVEAAGDLGGLSLQELYHGGVGIDRDVPQSYDSFSAVAPAAAASVRLRWERGIVGAAVEASAEAGLGIGTSAAAGLCLWAGSEASHIQVTTGGLAAAWEGASPTLQEVAAHDTGFFVDVDCMAGRLKTFIELYPFEGISTGGYGMLLALGSAAPAGGGLPLGVELFCPAGSVAPGQRVLLPLGDPRLRFYVSQGGGWWSLPRGGRTGWRFADYGTGVQARLFTGIGAFDVEAAVSAGLFSRIVTEQTLEETRSTMLGERWAAGVRVQPTLAVGLLEGRDGGRLRASGIGVGCMYDATLLTGSPAPESRPLALVLFAFGETR